MSELIVTHKYDRNVRRSFHNRVSDIVIEMANGLMDHWSCGEDYPLRIGAKRRGRSNGGGYKYEVNIIDAYDTAKKLTEYASIAKKPVIGSISGDNDTVLRAICAHEVAHWWHHSRLREEFGTRWGSHVSRKRGSLDAPHGSRWQMIYRDLRYMFVNPETRGSNPWHVDIGIESDDLLITDWLESKSILDVLP
jgi:hypothetical protein